MARRIEVLDAGHVQAGDASLPVAVRVDPRARRLTLRFVDGTARVTDVVTTV